MASHACTAAPTHGFPRLPRAFRRTWLPTPTKGHTPTPTKGSSHTRSFSKALPARRLPCQGPTRPPPYPGPFLQMPCDEAPSVPSPVVCVVPAKGLPCTRAVLCAAFWERGPSCVPRLPRALCVRCTPRDYRAQGTPLNQGPPYKGPSLGPCVCGAYQGAFPTSPSPYPGSPLQGVLPTRGPLSPRGPSLPRASRVRRIQLASHLTFSLASYLTFSLASHITFSLVPAWW